MYTPEGRLKNRTLLRLKAKKTPYYDGQNYTLPYAIVSGLLVVEIVTSVLNIYLMEQ